MQFESCVPLQLAEKLGDVHRLLVDRPTLVLLHAPDAVCIILRLVVRMQHALQLLDGAVGPGHRGHPRLQVVGIDLGAEDVLPRLAHPRAMNLRHAGVAIVGSGASEVSGGEVGDEY